MDEGELRAMMAALHETGGFAELYRITRFLGIRTNAQGRTLTVQVEVLDAGPDRADRYMVMVLDEDNRAACGRPAGDVRTAASTVPWEELDWDFFVPDALAHDAAQCQGLPLN